MAAPKRILAIDTSTGPCSVALWSEGRIAAYAENSKPVMQSASLVPMVEDALAQAGITYNDLGAVAATIGPGSFTGIRVGLAAARGIAMAAGIPGLGFTTLEVLAHAARKHSAERVLAILNAGKGEWYYQSFERGKALFAPRLGAPGQALLDAPAPMVVAGNVLIDAQGFTSCGVTFPRADALAELAAAAPPSAHGLRPFYIRAPDAKLPVKAL